MNKFKLVPYSLRLKTSRISGYLPQDNIVFDGSIINIVKLLERFLVYYINNYYDVESNLKTLSIESFNIDENIVTGTIKAGRSGFEADFYNRVTKTSIKNAKKREHSEEKPFRFYFCSSKSFKDISYIIFENYEQYGVKTLMIEAFSKFLKDANSDIILELNHLISKELIEDIKNKALVRIKVTSKQLSKDIADLFDNPEELSQEIVINAKRSGGIIVNKFRELSRNIITPYFEINESTPKVKLTYKDQGLQKTIQIDSDDINLRESKVIENLSKEDFNRGYPKEEIVFESAKDYMNHILGELKVK